MADYAKMYRRLLGAQCDAIKLLQAAHQETEDIYSVADDTPIELFSKDDSPKDDD